MAAEWFCEFCQRRDAWMVSHYSPKKWIRCQPRDGEVVNSIGCTGACLYWCIHQIRNPGIFPDFLDDWFMSDEDCSCLERICDGINEAGYALLVSVDCLPSISNVGPSMTLEDWVFLAWDRWKYRYANLSAWEIDEYYPYARRILQS